MFCINVWLTANNVDDVDELKSLLTEAAGMSRQEPGCLRFEVYHSQDDPAKLLLVERWESKEAWEAHKEREAVTSIYIPKVLPKVERVPHFLDVVSE